MKTPARAINLATLVGLCLYALPLCAADGGDPAVVPLSDSWPSFSGDLSGRRYSALAEVTRDNVKHLTLAWATRVAGGTESGSGGMFAGPSPPLIVGGEAAEAVVTGGLYSSALPISIRGAIVEMNGVLFASAPDNAWAIDARTGAVLWHYYWKTKGGTHTSNKGMGIHGDSLFFETADDYLVSLDTRTGKELWHKEIASFPEQYFSESAPIVVGDHVLVGVGNDADEPGSLRAFDARTGAPQWTFHTTPMNPGDPGLDTWPSLEAARHGGGNVWTAGAYDPESRLYIFGTGNPTPAYGSSARKGDNLFTCALVAVDIDTGKLAWYYQTSPHDTHDWDSSQTPVLVDGQFNGKPRKLVLQATRNGHFFVIDRVTGEHLLTTRYTPWGKWVQKINAKGQPMRDASRDVSVGGTILSIDGWTNWPPPAFSPQTGLYYFREFENYGALYYTETDPHGAMGLGGTTRGGQVSLGSSIQAIDYRSGKIAWEHHFETGQGFLATLGSGLLATAGGLLFAADQGSNLVAFDAEHGTPLWHTRLQNVSNAPETYLLDGHQYVMVAAGDMLYAFTLY
jgi:alcohol dehydrogenase (cytochrome c)